MTTKDFHLHSLPDPFQPERWSDWHRLNTGHGDTVVTALTVDPLDDTLLLGVRDNDRDQDAVALFGVNEAMRLRDDLDQMIHKKQEQLKHK